MSKLRVLQIADESWAVGYPLPENLNWQWVRPQDLAELMSGESVLFDAKERLEKSVKPYDVVVVDTVDLFEYVTLLDEYIDVYRLFYSSRSRIQTDTLAAFLKKKKAICDDFSEPQALIHLFSRGFHHGQYGDKLGVKQLKVDQNFTGHVGFQGSNYMDLSGEFGSEFHTIAHYLYNIVADGDNPIEIWPEFIVSEGCEIRYIFHGLKLNQQDITAKKIWVYDRTCFDKPWILDSLDSYYISVTIEIKGSGRVSLGPCHFRSSHLGYGDLLIGGGRIMDSRREELIYYFHPGDMKPPLNVYFSGYRPAEGFEGYYMMKMLNSPFLLIGDPRVEGGAFYLGSQELEDKLVAVIQESLDYLGLTNEQLILSGLSMGTFGALYYSARLNPYAVVVGKPLINLGRMAELEATTRPGGFPTSLDLVYRTMGSLDYEATERLDKRFWNLFEQGDFSKTHFIISYMYHDDYDMTAYHDLLENLSKRTYRVNVISKGLIGRHNDDTDGIIHWFLTQYRNMLARQFERRFDT